jgi:L-ascorbate metabolism protein UlaG (beta-lactamase superfamily)
VHIDTAEFFADEMQGLKADVLCLCAIGRKYRPNYVAEAVALLEPKIVVACHWDWFFTPYEAEPKCLPGVDLPGFVEEITDAGAEAVVLPFDGVLGLHS